MDMRTSDARKTATWPAIGAAAGGVVAAALIQLAAAPAARAVPFWPEPPCIVTGTGQCVPDTVWPIPAHGGSHPLPPIDHQPVPPVDHQPVPPVDHQPVPPVDHQPVPPAPSGPPEVITCIVNEGCFTYPAGGPVDQYPVDPGAAADTHVAPDMPFFADPPTF